MEITLAKCGSTVHLILILFVCPQTDKLAMGLLALGIKKGDRVGMWGPSTLEWVLTQFATCRIGAIMVNINPVYRVLELEYALKMVKSCCILLPSAENKI